jgi:hypothetical protein
MLVRAYLPNFITALFAGLFIAGGILTFGNADVFDRLYFGILIFTAVICRKNINVLSVLIILFAQLSMEELAWLYRSDSYVVKIILYSTVIWFAYYFRYDWVAKAIFYIVILVIFSEVYWYLTDYPPPQFYWHIWIMLSNLLVRYFLFSRVSLLDEYFPGKGMSTNLDWVIYRLSALVIITQIAITLEYLARHILGFSSVLFIYYSYEYIIHGLATFAIWATFHESYKQLLPRLLKA